MGKIMDAFKDNKNLLTLDTKDDDNYIGIVIIDEGDDYIIVQDVLSRNENIVIAKSDIKWLGEM